MNNKIDIIFHVGPGKTGSSSIQKTLKENKELLLNEGIFYVGLNLELFCSESWNKLPWGYNSLSAEELTLTYIDSFKKITSNPKVKKIIISNEGFLKNSEKLIQLYKFLNESERYNLYLYAYIRSPENWMISGYQQWGIKHKHYAGKIISAKEYVSGNPYKKITQSLTYLSENGLRKNLIINSVEFVGDVVSDFINKINCPSLDKFKENESLSSADKCLTYFYNNQFIRPVMPQESSRIIKRIKNKDVYEIIEITNITERTFNEKEINSTKNILNSFLPAEQSYENGVNLSPSHKNIVDKDLVAMAHEVILLDSKIKKLNPDLLRNIAISLEKTNVEYSKYLMSLAKLVRPNGPLINKKIKKYNKVKHFLSYMSTWYVRRK